MKQKAIFFIFKGLSLKQIKENPTLGLLMESKIMHDEKSSCK